jgi:hypothetical protein
MPGPRYVFPVAESTVLVYTIGYQQRFLPVKKGVSEGGPKLCKNGWLDWIRTGDLYHVKVAVRERQTTETIKV